jgi:hypothetical protein
MEPTDSFLSTTTVALYVTDVLPQEAIKRLGRLLESVNNEGLFVLDDYIYWDCELRNKPNFCDLGRLVQDAYDYKFKYLYASLSLPGAHNKSEVLRAFKAMEALGVHVITRESNVGALVELNSSL